MGHSLEYWVWFLVIGLVIGWVAGLISRGRGFGVMGDIAVGVLGAVVGEWFFGVLGLYTSSSFGAFLMAVIGALILIGITRFIQHA